MFVTLWSTVVYKTEIEKVVMSVGVLNQDSPVLWIYLYRLGGKEYEIVLTKIDELYWESFNKRV